MYLSDCLEVSAQGWACMWVWVRRIMKKGRSMVMGGGGGEGGGNGGG